MVEDEGAHEDEEGYQEADGDGEGGLVAAAVAAAGAPEGDEAADGDTETGTHEEGDHPLPDDGAHGASVGVGHFD